LHYTAARENQITPWYNGTGYWLTSDPQHPDYTAPTPSSHEYRSKADTLEGTSPPALPGRFSTPEGDDEEQPIAGPSRLFGETPPDQETTELEGQTLPDPELSEELQESLDTFYTRRQAEDLAEDTKVVTAQLQYGLDIQERYQPDPPDYPTQQSAIRAAVVTGHSPPSLPPLIAPRPLPVFGRLSRVPTPAATPPPVFAPAPLHQENGKSAFHTSLTY
jgi:phenylpropionate dioxygenase-like ring-hydroxylating dioxygenase large terminal subunit